MNRWGTLSCAAVLLSGCGGTGGMDDAGRDEHEQHEPATSASELVGDQQWIRTSEFGNTGGVVGIVASSTGRITEVGETHRKLLLNFLNGDGSAPVPASRVITRPDLMQIAPVAMATQYAPSSDGNDKMVIVGVASKKVKNCWEDASDCDDRVFVARIGATDLDTQFIGSGATSIDLDPARNYERATALAIAPNRDIVIVAQDGLTADVARIGLLRLYSGGTTDLFFQKGPKAPISGLYEVPTGVRLQSSGKIIVAGNSNNGLFVRRFDENGNADLSFGVSGTGFTRYSGTAWGLAVDGNDRIVVVGGTNKDAAGPGKAQVIRLTRDGAFDPAFCDTPPSCGDGVTLLDSGQNWQEARAVRFDASQRIVVAGRAHSSAGADWMFLGRVLATGYEDTSLGVDGTRIYRPTGTNANANTLEVVAGSYLLGGYADKVSTTDTVNNYVATLRVSQ